jgi:tetratricopeptide (TPR) repeat protein
MVKTNKPKSNLKPSAINYSPSHDILAYFEQAEGLYNQSNFLHAKEMYREILSADKQFTPALRQLGLCELQLNETSNAIKMLAKYIKSAPNDQLAQAKLGQAYFIEGKPAKAKPHVARAIRISPTADLYFLAATIDETLGEPLKALAHYESGLALDPERLSAKLAVGLIYKNLPDYNRAIDVFNDILNTQPDHASALSNLGTVYHALGLFEQALECYQNAHAVNPSADIAYNQGLSYQQLLQGERSLAAFQLALSTEPEHLTARIQLAETYSSQGLFVEFEKTLEEAVSLDNDNFHVWYLKTSARRFTQYSTDIEKKLCDLKTVAKTTEEKCFVHFGLGKIYDDTGRYDLAFEHFDIANKQRFRLVKSTMQAQLDGLNPSAHLVEPFELSSENGKLEKLAPVFIIGMPRSGTTLLERVVAGAPNITPCGELDYFGPALFRRSAGVGEFRGKASMGLITKTEAMILRAGYLERVCSVCDTAGDFIDKTPDNFRYLPLLTSIFPKARIIHCQRHPLDTAVSIYFQLFDGLSYSNNLGTIAQYYSKYREYIEHYRDRHAGRWLNMNYEDLVREPATSIGLLSEYLKCNIEQSLHANQASINTMSKWQARQGIYQGSIDRWRHYENHLDALKTALALFQPE